jgi:hypothetical protein
MTTRPIALMKLINMTGIFDSLTEDQKENVCSKIKSVQLTAHRPKPLTSDEQLDVGETELVIWFRPTIKMRIDNLAGEEVAENSNGDNTFGDSNIDSEINTEEAIVEPTSLKSGTGQLSRDFEFKSSKLSARLTKILQNRILKVSNTDLNELIDCMFKQMLDLDM